MAVLWPAESLLGGSAVNLGRTVLPESRMVAVRNKEERWMIPEIFQEKGMIAGDATAHGKAERKDGFVALSREMLQTLSMLLNLCESHCAALCNTGVKIPTTGCLQGPLSRCPVLIGTFVATHDRGLTPISVERWKRRLLFSGCLLLTERAAVWRVLETLEEEVAMERPKLLGGQEGVNLSHGRGMALDRGRDSACQGIHVTVIW